MGATNDTYTAALGRPLTEVEEACIRIGFEMGSAPFRLVEAAQRDVQREVEALTEANS
jgi:hypothetical protein